VRESRVVTSGSGAGGQAVVDCRGPGIYSTTDPDLAPSPDTGLLDQSADAPAGAGRTVDLTACLATRSVAWNPGDTAQQVYFRLQ
jgi:hypothetical protein